MRLLLASLAAALVGVGAGASPARAAATSCPGLQTQLRHSDVVAFVTVTDVALPSDPSEDVFYRVSVDQGLRGDLSAVATVRSAIGAPGYGRPRLTTGESYLLLATQSPTGPVTIGACSGTRRATPSLVLAVTGSVVLTALR
ncbi:hypothetical protein L6241_09030 [Janibacter sp. Y6]|uniref:hypothetical protein n=1 Tax=Janibacter sp. Y6 TaxID=2913552 RepID=UPI0034A309BC